MTVFESQEELARPSIAMNLSIPQGPYASILGCPEKFTHKKSPHNKCAQ